METPCKCGLPAKWASDASVPVSFDASLNEFHLLGASGSSKWLMNYCPSCGGRLPESTRGELFTLPDPGEVAELRALLAEVTSVESMRALLGDPDDTFPGIVEGGWLEHARHYGTSLYERQYNYWSRWKSVRLMVQERADGTVTFGYTGQPKARTA